jgi:ribonucleoside-diphosphate reductase alpha chain
VTDAQLTDFKLAALRALTPLASAVLIDRQFAWRQAIDQAAFPWPQQTALARAQRRIGLGVLGLGDALIMLGLRYDSPVARAQSAALMQEIQCAAWETSLARACSMGATTACPAASLLHAGHSASRLPAELQSEVRRHGTRNTHLTSIAPTGTLALAWADNASPGIEPVFAHEGDRLRQDAQGALRPMGLSSPALRLWRTKTGSWSQRPPAEQPCAPTHPPAWQTVETVSPSAQIAMVAAMQPWVDAGISKTLALPADATPSEVSQALRLAWRCGLKGLAVYRMPAWPCG